MANELLSGTVVRQVFVIQRWYPDDEEKDGGRWDEEDDTDPCGSFKEADEKASQLLQIYPTRRFAIVKRTTVEEEVRTYQTSRSHY